ncbi:hypothetical protein CBF23_001725 [Marinomonas agarivorans]|nr:hypothetical protein CBF23_001725 [Marinomonas agarivorans]
MKVLIKNITNIIWWSVVLSVVAIAVGLILFKQLSPYIDGYRVNIERNLTQILGYPVSIGALEASLIGVNPNVAVTNVTINVPIADNADIEAVTLASLNIELDLLSTFFHLEPTFSQIRFNEAKVSLVEKDGRWSLLGASQSNDDSGNGFNRGLAYLLNQDHISLFNVEIELLDSSLTTKTVSSSGLFLQRTNDGFGVSGSLQHSDYDNTFQFNGEWIGDLSEPETLNFEAFVSVSDIQLSAKDFLAQPEFAELKTNLSADIWVAYQPQKAVNLSGSVKSDIQGLYNKDYQLESDFKLNYGLLDQAIDIDLVNLTVSDVSNRTFSPMNITASIDSFSHKKSISIGFDAFNLDLAQQIFSPLLKPEWFVSKMLKSMQLEGVAENGRLAIWLDDTIDYQYRSNVFIKTSAGYENIPAVDNLTAIFELDSQGGAIEFVSDQSVLQLPYLINEEVQADALAGRVAWQQAQDAFVITGDDLYIEYGNADIYGAFRFEAPENEERLFLLDLHGKNLSIADRQDYLPKNVLADEIVEWIQDRLLSGVVEEFDLVLQAPLGKNQANPHTLIALNSIDGEVKFADDWPIAQDVVANFRLDDTGVVVDVEQAVLNEVAVSQLQVQLPVVDKKVSYLSIDGKVQENGNELLNLLRSTSLKNSVLQPFESWQLDGDINADFHVIIPFNNEKKSPDLSLNLDFNDNDLIINSLNLPIHIHTGHFEYNSQTGIDNSSFQVSTLGGDANVRFFGVQPVNQPVQIRADLQGDADIAAIAGWLQFPQKIVNHMMGQINLTGNIGINVTRPRQLDLSFTSNLAGVQLNLPSPLGKFPEEVDNIELNVSSYEQSLTAQTSYRNHRIKINFDSEGFYGGEIFVNDEREFNAEVKKGIVLKGNINSFNHAPWFAFFNDLTVNETSEQFNFLLPEWFTELDFIANRIFINDDNEFNNVKILYDNTRPLDGLQVIADEMAVRITENDHGPVVHFDYLSWNTASEEEGESQKQPFNARQIPNATFSVNELYVDTKPFGDWELVTHNSGDLLRISPIRSKLENGNFVGSLLWLDSEAPTVQFTLDIAGEKLEEVVGKFAEEPFISSDEYKVAFVFNWLGSPFTFNNETLSGVVSLFAENGRITALDTMPQFLKALGIFNLNALARRLTLDFSDVNLPGLTYDSLSAELTITDGILETTEPLEVISPTINATLEGTANLIEEVFDEKLTASFPLGGTLPIAGLLLGATPQTAGLVFLTDKLLGDPLSKVVSIEYTIKGPFSEPVIERVEAEPRPRKKRD